MPKPLALPATPTAAVHVSAPKTLLTEALSYAPGSSPQPRELLRRAVQASGSPFEAKLVPFVGLSRPWNLAVVDGQTIMHVPLRPDSVDKVGALLASKKAKGDFGAVEINRGPDNDGPKLAYLDRGAKTLTLADDLRGIATGPELQRAYGKQPIFISVSRKQAARYGVQLPVQRITATGTGVEDLEVAIKGAPAIPELGELQKGALTGLLESPQIAVGGSSKYRNYKQPVESIISRAKRETSKQNFLIRGNLEDMTKRLASMLRSWNGRVMVGVGPANHLLVGLGANNVGKMSKSTQFFMRGVIDNIKTAKTFGVGVPAVRFNPNVLQGAGSQIHTVVLDGARKYVPAELHNVIGPDGKLRIAMAFPNRAGAGMLVVGAQAKEVMQRWLEDTKKATPGAKTVDHFASATVAVGPKAIQRVVASPQAAAGLQANRPPTKLVLRRDGEDYTLRIKGKKTARVGRARNSAP